MLKSSLQVFVLQQFDPGMEYRPDWGLKHPPQQIQAKNGANSLVSHQAAGRILRGANVQGPPGPPGAVGPQQQAQQQVAQNHNNPRGAQNPNAGPGPGGGAGQDDKS